MLPGQSYRSLTDGDGAMVAWSFAGKLLEWHLVYPEITREVTRGSVVTGLPTSVRLMLLLFNFHVKLHSVYRKDQNIYTGQTEHQPCFDSC
jgi:hypothetical protein